uniref:Ig-like domain-containing protein n=1 Tax=Pelusios castaneus TaxID=367368 RepID=A0A8C8RHI5_9SAUR
MGLLLRLLGASYVLSPFALPIGVSCQIKVDQSPPSLSGSEGKISTLICNYSSTVSYVQWYRQFPGESPAFLLSLYQDGNVTRMPNFIAELLGMERRSHLRIDGSQLSDSANYFCAVASWHLERNEERNSMGL